MLKYHFMLWHHWVILYLNCRGTSFMEWWYQIDINKELASNLCIFLSLWTYNLYTISAEITDNPESHQDLVGLHITMINRYRIMSLTVLGHILRWRPGKEIVKVNYDMNDMRLIFDIQMIGHDFGVSLFRWPILKMRRY